MSSLGLTSWRCVNRIVTLTCANKGFQKKSRVTSLNFHEYIFRYSRPHSLCRVSEWTFGLFFLRYNKAKWSLICKGRQTDSISDEVTMVHNFFGWYRKQRKVCNIKWIFRDFPLSSSAFCLLLRTKDNKEMYELFLSTSHWFISFLNWKLENSMQRNCSSF